jgi:uncharacterized protein YkwD
VVKEVAITPRRKLPVLALLAGAGWVLGHGVLPAVALSGQAACFLGAVNAARHSAGVAPVAPDARLSALADAHAAKMAAAGAIFHSTALAAQVPAGWQAVGENVGMGPGCRAIAQAFLRSPEHRANILAPGYGSIGVGVAVGDGGTVYVTEDFLGTARSALATAGGPAASR